MALHSNIGAQCDLVNSSNVQSEEPVDSFMYKVTRRRTEFTSDASRHVITRSINLR